MPATSELQNFKKKIHIEVVLVYSENTRTAVKDWKMPKHGTSVPLKNAHFILYLHRPVLFCLCHSTVQGLYEKCLA